MVRSTAIGLAFSEVTNVDIAVDSRPGIEATGRVMRDNLGRVSNCVRVVPSSLR